MPGDANHKHVDLVKWYADVLGHYTAEGFDVRFRHHPQAKAPVARPVRGETLQDDLAWADVVVTFNSNVAVDAVINGVPTITVDKKSVAWPVTTHQLDEIGTFSREHWLRELVSTQWAIEEMKSGEAWDNLKTKYA